jgi:hypothetical protein
MITEKMSLKNARIGYKYLLCRQTIKTFENGREGRL